jgi:hypothetical protein
MLRDRAIQLHDLFSPPFVSYHRSREVRGWVREAGFQLISQTEYRTTGGVPERLESALRRYRTVCRPGFGMLCRSRVPEGSVTV